VKRVLLPFDLPIYDRINSNHPLLVSLTDQRYQGVEFVRASAGQPAPYAAAAQRAADTLATQLTAGLGAIPRNEDALRQFIASRDPDSQARIDPGADLAFFHTAPMLLGQLPYLLHTESLTTLFHPMLVEGDCTGIELRQQYVYWFVRAMLEAPACRGIFTNLESTQAQIDRVLASEIISRKTRHVPAGPYFTPDEEARVAAAVERKRDKADIDILFTNSWHQRTPSFVLRGGLDLLLAFFEIEAQFPQLRLTLRSGLPDILEGTDIGARVRQHPKIRLLPDRLSDAEMLDLLLGADIFFLDAASVHSISILRAMYCGAACVVSDVPGYEEYVTPDETAIVVAGRRAAIYSEDPGSGWLRGDFRPMFRPDGARLARIATALHTLCANREARLSLGANARRRVMAHNSFAGWKRGFEAALRDALAA
jgi:glycosyltransferase involved in cell wall biosynthesis